VGSMDCYNQGIFCPFSV